MSGTVPPIAGSIVIDRGLEKRPVFFVRVNGQPLVVKGEKRGDDDTPISIYWSSRLMKHANHELVNTKIMTDAEVTVFLQAAQLQFPNPSPQRDNVTVEAANMRWVKMPLVDGLSDVDYKVIPPGKRFARPETPKVKKAMSYFANPLVWMPLGEILAVDIFNGNGDRFDIETGEWINQGNVMFIQIEQNAIPVPIGLDTYDHFSNYSNLVSTGEFRALGTLNDGARQSTFAENCTKNCTRHLKRTECSKRIS